MVFEETLGGAPAMERMEHAEAPAPEAPKDLEEELASEEENADVDMVEGEEGKAKKRARKRVHCHDLKKMFDAGKSLTPPKLPLPSPARAGQQPLAASCFNLKVSSLQEVPDTGLSAVDDPNRLELQVHTAPVNLQGLELVPVLTARLPLQNSGKAIFQKLPATWLDITGNTTALGTRCLFTSRRHENSVFEALAPERFLQVPEALQEWQLPMLRSGDMLKVENQEPWILQVHPGQDQLRVLVRPGALLQRMLRRGAALPVVRFTWRLRDTTVQRADERHAATMGEFSILSNLEDAATTQPPHFHSFPLRREQLRSLGWMLSQERQEKEAFATELCEAESCPDANHWRLEGSLRCEYLGVRGGVLADAIGYGKTACTIGLVDKTKELTMPRVPMPYRGFVPSRATLVLAPSNLHNQWLQEIKKFTGNHLTVLSVPTCAQLKRLSMKDLAEADVVVATYRLFYSQPYLTRLEELAREILLGFTFPKQSGGQQLCSEWSEAYRRAFEVLPTWAARRVGLRTEEGESQGKRRRLNKKQMDGSQAFASEEPSKHQAAATQFVPLEAFWWRRVVCDEFHELLTRYPPAQVAVELFHADFKWGLSGTLPCQTLQKVRKAASFFGVQLPEDDREEARKVAQEWLDAFARRNTSELPPLEEEEKIVPVRQTPKERALYLALTEQQSQDLAASQLATEMPEEIKALKEVGKSTTGLLKICSHFCASGASNVLSAEDECQRQLQLRRMKLSQAQRDAKALADKALATVQLVQHFEPHFARTPTESNCEALGKVTKASLTSRLKWLGEAVTQGSKAELLEQLLSATRQRPAAVKAKVLHGIFELKSAGKLSQLQDTEDTRAAESLWQQLVEGDDDVSTGAAAVKQAVQDALSAGSNTPARCLKMRSQWGMPAPPENRESEEANWKWMSNRANAEKLQKMLGTWKVDILLCARQLETLKAEITDRNNSLESFQDSLQASQMAQQPEDTEHEGSQFAKYGSKIETLVRHVQKIQRDDPGCKIICFVQWEDLKKKISDALKEFQVPHATLHGGVWARQTVLRKFQYEFEGPRMLLLSLEESASGTNLTAANHVLMVHPMEAENKEEAVAFEMQAMGRVRRPGQMKKIFIWRFVTFDTIEQQITEEHQKELWERQAATIQLSQPAAQEPVSDDETVPAVIPEAPKGREETAFLATQCYAADGVKGIEEDEEVVIENKISRSSGAVPSPKQSW
ncbi:unnamed protein product [Effrenium voratum]|nr:unnamed protein product [Effrenium voratum]